MNSPLVLKHLMAAFHQKLKYSPRQAPRGTAVAVPSDPGAQQGLGCDIHILCATICWHQASSVQVSHLLGHYKEANRDHLAVCSVPSISHGPSAAAWARILGCELENLGLIGIFRLDFQWMLSVCYRLSSSWRKRELVGRRSGACAQDEFGRAP